MGVDFHGARLLMLAKREGASFDRVLTLGHQWLNIEMSDMRPLFRKMRVPVVSGRLEDICRTAPYADGFLHALGAASFTSMDASAYEKASVVHDMNLDVPDAMEGGFSLVFDGGTLEHVFNFPTAIRNCMRLLEVGGYFLSVTCANNFMGHGFYQFSPELFYRVFSPSNGFRVVHMFAAEGFRWAPWYEVKDPIEVSGRVELVNAAPTYLLILAQKVSQSVPFKMFPQQSDYEQKSWVGEGAQMRGASEGIGGLVKRHVPAWMRALRYGVRRGFRPKFDSKYYKRANW